MDEIEGDPDVTLLNLKQKENALGNDNSVQHQRNVKE